MTYQTTLIAAVVALIALMAIMATALAIAGRLDSDSTPLMVTVFGTVSSTVVALLAVLRSDRAVGLVHQTNGDVHDLKRRMEISDPGGDTKREVYPEAPEHD
jgi:tellurite resistance protein TehA-like permease